MLCCGLCCGNMSKRDYKVATMDGIELEPLGGEKMDKDKEKDKEKQQTNGNTSSCSSTSSSNSNSNSNSKSNSNSNSNSDKRHSRYDNCLIARVPVHVSREYKKRSLILNSETIWSGFIKLLSLQLDMCKVMDDSVCESSFHGLCLVFESCRQWN
uniref:Uncharacterized protein n=1 Tax=Glossina palpalis gambiensis TaxID=67801 RepID=A0A1B0B1M2_9MUSC